MNFVDDEDEVLDDNGSDDADNIVDEFTGSDDEEISSEVEVRLEEANCYKALLRQSLFDRRWSNSTKS